MRGSMPFLASTNKTKEMTAEMNTNKHPISTQAHIRTLTYLDTQIHSNTLSHILTFTRIDCEKLNSDHCTVPVKQPRKM